MIHVKNFTQAYSQAPWRKQIQMIGLFTLGVVFASLVAGIYLDVTARTATLGRRILSQQVEIKNLEIVNADLRTQLADLTSARRMRQRALDMGFRPIEMGQPVFIQVPGYVKNQGVKIAPLPGPVTTMPAALPLDYKESLFDWVLRKVLPLSGRLIEVLP